ncbi:hypothetical protein COT42_01160 [Candidatus Saganbacteria bacterium CG08_land_8_20_14_0_20_45_16]|uniref:Uncharacterized protein n=1 Tax=Candidatus Saganbacteria bacterium CG08_land_8_20_14_0_20_45_16 TaxID=2014293 RepID=A0A2H0Y1G6_UNCSA|nr:MAG: hypothetical protein COT42_01160 [Candidatus Saganbacteria bacterium CG08_land_8_20_14_0_20_45_16]
MSSGVHLFQGAGVRRSSVDGEGLRKPVTPRVPSRHSCLTLRHEEVLNHDISDGVFRLDVITRDGVAAGKALLQLIQIVEITTCYEAVVNIEGPVDLQFLTMYLAALPGADFPKRFGSSSRVAERKLTINLIGGSSAEIFNLITNTQNGPLRAITRSSVFQGWRYFPCSSG